MEAFTDTLPIVCNGFKAQAFKAQEEKMVQKWDPCIYMYQFVNKANV